MFNHAFTIAFTVETENDNENVTSAELWAGLTKRIAFMKEEELDLNSQETILEACDAPYDSYEFEKEEEDA